jgi:hypothetical protein
LALWALLHCFELPPEPQVAEIAYMKFHSNQAAGSGNSKTQVTPSWWNSMFSKSSSRRAVPEESVSLLGEDPASDGDSDA